MDNPRCGRRDGTPAMKPSEPNRATAAMPRTASEKDREANPGYAAFHEPRFAFLLAMLQQHARGRPLRILDVGRSPMTGRIAERLGTRVDSLGLEPDEDLPTGRHHHIDLNDARTSAHAGAPLGPYDVVVFAEVLEHLHAAPEPVLAFLRGVMKPGGRLLLQTPNAASLSKRVKLALGVQPFERIRVDPENPGHYREYTRKELVEILREAAFTVDEVWHRHYFDLRFARHETGGERPAMIAGAIRNVAYRALPPFLREGITILATRDRAP